MTDGGDSEVPLAGICSFLDSSTELEEETVEEEPGEDEEEDNSIFRCRRGRNGIEVDELAELLPRS